MSTKKRGLGKGLSALISDEVDIDHSNIHKESIRSIDINLIVANGNQPRQEFHKEALDELASSIEENGLIQPIIVRKIKDKYEIIAGERRWRACKTAGLKEIPCILKDVTEDVSAKFALIENIQREDLSPIEEAVAYKKLMSNFNLTQDEVASQVGKSRSYISNTIRLLNLDKDIIDYIAKGELTAGHGKVLLGIKDKNEQLSAAKKIINNNLNVRETESIVREKEKPTKKLQIKRKKDPYAVDLEDSLMKALGTKVSLIQGNKKGKIEIEYYGNEDLERLIDILTN
ncbi:ParB/RepB/Spo0J family partition protein [Tissierella sp.]|uniref:ParB/RepB/Spo0J family partition protein n=1 Tax=Tissierella sp. TaxID=41274 RepID=UPI002867A9A0|nr:ParB/RepB/Spo0J family partition protein [Tissierella sp.]MDR7854977.1 ParB/RepB/Spo0J family partition protein [Tissierella sp.]